LEVHFYKYNRPTQGFFWNHISTHATLLFSYAWYRVKLNKCEYPYIFWVGESMKKGANHAKVKVLSKDYIFHMVVFYWFIVHFSHNFFNWISNLRPNMIYNMIKAQFVLHQTLHYNQIYNFTLNHDYKFKTIIL
jgi:hypothetical protein